MVTATEDWEHGSVCETDLIYHGGPPGRGCVEAA